MSLDSTDLLLVQDTVTKTLHKVTFANLSQDVKGEINYDSRYILETGDNMTGDLTLGTDKITLNATDGAITAAGEAFFGNSDYYNKFYTSGTHEIYNKDWPTTNNALDIKGSTGSVFTVLGNGSIIAAGDGTFQGKIRLDLDTSSGNATAFDVINNGSAPAGIVYRVWDTGQLGIGGDLNNIATAATPNISLNADGSALFKGNVESGFDDGNANGVQLVSSGYLNIRNDTTTADCLSIYAGGVDAANKTCGIKSDGSPALRAQ